MSAELEQSELQTLGSAIDKMKGNVNGNLGREETEDMIVFTYSVDDDAFPEDLSKLAASAATGERKATLDQLQRSGEGASLSPKELQAARDTLVNKPRVSRR